MPEAEVLPFENDNESTFFMKMEHISKLYKAKSMNLFRGDEKSLSLGNNDLDAFLDGIPTDSGIITIAGESGMGKSRLLKTLMYHLSICQNIPCAYISGRKHWLREADVFLAGTLGLSFSEMKRAGLHIDEEKIISTETKIYNSPLYYHSTCNQEIDISELRTMMHVAIRNHGIRFLFIDGFQQINYPLPIQTDIRYIELFIAKELKRFSSELGIPIIVTSRLNWTFYNRECGGRPLPKDLAEIGELQEMSNLVLTVFRPEVYGIDQDVYGNNLLGTTEVAIVKNDFGACKSGTFFTNGPIFDYKYMFEANHTEPIS